MVQDSLPIGRGVAVQQPDQDRIVFGPWAEGRSSTVNALVIVNERAGSVGAGGRDKLLVEMEALGARAIKTVAEIDELAPSDAAGADVIIVLGGDGTASLAAGMFGAGPPLILLPGGTRNLLPHALHGHLAWPEALQAALIQGRVMRLTGGEANGRKFFVAAFFGAATFLAGAREAARLGRFGLAMSGLRRAFSTFFSRRLAVRPMGGIAARAVAVGVLCPAYRGELEAEALEWVRLKAAQIVDLLRVGARSLLGGWRQDSAIDLTTCQGGDIRSAGIIPAVLDGEPTTFESRVRVRILTPGPRVIVTRAPAHSRDRRNSQDVVEKD